MGEFAPIESGALTYEARQGLIQIGIMPKCIVYAHDLDSGLPLSVTKSQSSERSSGFPIYDLAQQYPEESRSRFSRFKLAQIHGATLQDTTSVNAPELVSQVGPQATFDSNINHPQCESAVYYPTFAVVESYNRERLRPLNIMMIIDDLHSRRPKFNEKSDPEAVKQLVDLHIVMAGMAVEQIAEIRYGER
ncbi:MAG: hypothetical protein M3Q79_00315 [bacterium]|nr:hypothetical protein [bacterium]